MPRIFTTLIFCRLPWNPGSGDVEIDRPPHVARHRPARYRFERDQQRDRNARVFELLGDAQDGAASERMADQDDRTNPSAFVVADGVGRDRARLAVTVDARRNAHPGELAGESIQADRYIKYAAHQVSMRAAAVRRRGGLVREPAKQQGETQRQVTQRHDFPFRRANDAPGWTTK